MWANFGVNSGAWKDVFCEYVNCIVKAFRGRLAWARDPKGRERNLGEWCHSSSTTTTHCGRLGCTATAFTTTVGSVRCCRITRLNSPTAICCCLSSANEVCQPLIEIKSNHIIFNNKRNIRPLTVLYKQQIMTAYMTKHPVQNKNY